MLKTQFLDRLNSNRNNNKYRIYKTQKMIKSDNF